MGSAIFEGIEIASDPTSIAKYISDNIGLSNFQFNDELDKANQKFAEAICDVNLSSSKEVGEDNKYIKNIKKYLDLAKNIDEIAIKSESEYNKLSKPELYKTFYERAIAMLEEYCTELTPKLPSLKSELFTVLSETTEILGNLNDAVDFAKALAVSITMQETQLELIHDVIKTQMPSSTLYKGMTRLKNQLLNGFVSYFTTTYLTDKAFNKVIGYLPQLTSKAILNGWSSYGSTVVSVVKIVNGIVFKEWLGYDYSEYTSAIILTQYASDLYNSIQNKASVFSSQFDNSEIQKFEALYNAYIAMKVASFEECKKISKHNTTYNFEYADNVSVFFVTENAYQKYIEGVKTFIRAIPKANRITTDYGVWNINDNTILQSASDSIEENVIYAVGKRVTQEIYSESYDILINDSLSISKISTRNKLFTPTRDVHVYIDELCYITPQSSSVPYNIYFDSINITTNSLKFSSFLGTKSNIYLHNSRITIHDTFNLHNQTYLYIDENSILKANDIIVEARGGQYHSKITVNQGQLICNDLYLNRAPQSTVAWGSAAQSYLILNDDSALVEIMGNLVVDGITDGRVTQGNVSVNKGLLYAHGDIIFSSIYNYTASYGKIFLCGDKIQKIKNIPIYNLEIDNPFGIALESDINIYGNLKTNDNPIKQNGYSIRINTNSQIYGNNHFNSVYIDSSYSLISDLYCDYLVMNDSAKATLSIAEKTKLSVSGNLEIRYQNTVKNYGELEIMGDLLLRKNDFNGYADTKFYNYNLTNVFGNIVCGSYSYIFMENEQSILSVKGNINLANDRYCKVSAGTTILSGVEKQSITNYNCPIFVIENESKSGVVFETKINPSTLFNHNGNKFTLKSGGTFVDCDRDGLNDDEDPYPTLAIHPCLNFSAVSLAIHNNCSLRYKVNKHQMDNGYSNAYAVFTLGNRTVKVDKYTLSNDGRSYVFTFDNIAPDQMNDTISATLHAEFNGVKYVSETKEYSVAQYCYNILEKYSDDENAKLRTLLVDLLNYGSTAQLYTEHNKENLANAKLTEKQKSFATKDKPILTTVKNTAYKKIDNPSVNWKSAGLNLQKSVALRFKIASDSIEGLSVKVETASGNSWTIGAKAFNKTSSGYEFLFNELGAGQMSEPIYLTVYRGNTVVSNTICYSIESYAYAKQGSTDEALNNLLSAMIKYGNSAKTYAY